MQKDTKINSLSANSSGSWKPDFLIDHIISKHHSYVKKMLPVILLHSQDAAVIQGAVHPEIITIAEKIESLKEELEVHLQKEERMLFPYIKQMVELEKSGDNIPYPPFGSVENPIRVMESEHETALKLLDSINSLNPDFTLPADACSEYKLLLEELKEFENDLHEHINLENNILFTSAAELEKSLTLKK